MADFRYSAFDAGGKAVSGTMQARTQDEAMETLARQGLTVSELREVTAGAAPAPGPRSQAVGADELASFAYELSALLQAGVSLAPALELLVKDEKQSALSQVTLELLRDVRAGTAFSAALEKRPEVFPPIFPALVRAGEGTGGLEKSLAHISAYLEKADEARNKVLSSLAYPVMVSGMALTIITALFLFMVPRLKEIYGQIGAPIPAITAAFLNLGEVADVGAMILLVVGLVGLPSLRAYLGSAPGRRMMDRWKLQLPLLGDVFRQVALASFNKTLALLHGSGVPLPQGVAMAAAASGNTVIQAKYMQAVSSLREGRSLAISLGELGLYSQKMIGMIEAGEKSGNLSDMLSRMADFAENRTAHKVQRLMAMLEPLTIGFLGLLVGAAVLILGAPLLSLSSQIQ